MNCAGSEYDNSDLGNLQAIRLHNQDCPKKKCTSAMISLLRVYEKLFRVRPPKSGVKKMRGGGVKGKQMSWSLDLF
jgi:hypothetical protein